MDLQEFYFAISSATFSLFKASLLFLPINQTKHTVTSFL